MCFNVTSHRKVQNKPRHTKSFKVTSESLPT